MCFSPTDDVSYDQLREKKKLGKEFEQAMNVRKTRGLFRIDTERTGRLPTELILLLVNAEHHLAYSYTKIDS